MRIDPNSIEGFLIVNDEEVLAEVQKRYAPEEVFPEEELIQWAETNGLVEKQTEEE